MEPRVFHQCSFLHYTIYDFKSSEDMTFLFSETMVNMYSDYWPNLESVKENNGNNKKVAIETAIGVGAVVAAPSMVSAAGFKAGGVKAGSITAAWLENIGNVAADLCISIECWSSWSRQGCSLCWSSCYSWWRSSCLARKDWQCCRGS